MLNKPEEIVLLNWTVETKSSLEKAFELYEKKQQEEQKEDEAE